MKVVLGFVLIFEMLEKGIFVLIGIDGVFLNNRMDFMRDMYFILLIYKGRILNLIVVLVEEVLEMVIINGVKCVLLEKEIGSFEVGKKVDMIILNLDIIYCLLMYNLIGNIVYFMISENVDFIICDGKWLMKERKVLVVDEFELLNKVKK